MLNSQLLTQTTTIPLDTNMLAVYRFANGGTDLTRNKYNLTTNGALAYNRFPAIGQFSAGTFSDVNYYTPPAGLQTAFSNLTNWTIQFYFYLNTLSRNMVPIDFDQSGGQNTVQIYSDGHISNTVANVDVATAAGIITTKKWYHVAITYNGTIRRIYINNVIRAQSTTTGGIGGIIRFSVGRYTLVGGLSLDGYMNELIYSNIARTSFPSAPV